MAIRGWVYVIVNPAMPGLVKIGYSMKDPDLRAVELGHTGVPHPYTVVFDALVEEPRDLEQDVHKKLHDRREGKEWFRCSETDAISTIKATASVILLERSRIAAKAKAYEKDSLSVESEPLPVESELSPVANCQYFSCSQPSVISYKGTDYCDEHYRKLREQRFTLARSKTG